MKDPKKIKQAYELVNKINEIECDIDFYRNQAFQIAESKTDVTVHFQFASEKETKKQDVFDRDGFIKDQFLNRGNHLYDAQVMFFTNGQKIGLDTTKVESQIEQLAIKRKVKDTTALSIIGIIVCDLNKEKSRLISKLENIKL